MRTRIYVCIPTVFLLQVISSFSQSTAASISTLAADGMCFEKLDSNKLKLKRLWTVGVLAIRGPDAAYNEFNATFADYLTATAGQRFDPPIHFQMKPLNFLTLFSDSTAGLVDFIYVNPSAFSCIESEYGARSLASQISRRVIDGKTYNLKRFGGVIAARSDRDDIESITDLKDKTVAAASISGLGSGQMQFREMQNAGMSYINDPKQLVFTSNQGKVVSGLLNGDFDVGFVRTDQLENSIDANGDPINTSLFKVIDSKPGLHIDQVAFPFESSTPLYPEWNVGALDHVLDVVANELQGAMLAIGKHIEAAASKQQCEEEIVARNVVTNETAISDLCPFVPRRCDTTEEIATLALEASTKGKFSEWVPSLSYMELRNMQEVTGFIKNEDKAWRCLRSAEIYDSISCPAGHLKKSKELVNKGCALAGLKCGEGFQCICSPCYKPFECIDSVKLGNRCVPYRVFLPATLVPIALIFIATCFGALAWKSKQMVHQAEASAKNERDLNEFIAHEVRNPLSAALSASVFVNTAVQAGINESMLDSIREDAGIISSSLRFINDLLRSMLDVNRATRDQMVLEQDFVDILHDIFEPTASMVYARDTNFTVTIDCPEGLVVKSDKLRLQQVVLNLARNSAKFVDEGFVRLRAEVIEHSVHLFIEDSGPGIPEEKQGTLFSKYQKSLDSLAQGTGVGLSLVEKLVNLMEGSIWLDETYESGFNGHPGARLVIDLKQAPEASDGDEEHGRVIRIEDLQTMTVSLSRRDVNNLLPSNLSVLFVDDDRNLRKFARRSLLQLRPLWKIREAASGETALQICSTERYDLIFMDQYMTSVEQSLKGTETVRALRARGVTSVICGLSANNLHSVFENAGANTFLIKPFPNDQDILLELLIKLVGQQNAGEESGSTVVTVKQPLTCFGESPVPIILSESRVSSCRRDSDLASSCILPKTLSVLFVDDDRTLRRLAVRAMQKLIPDCRIRETNSGESALILCETDTFDIIFMDMYMTSTTDSMTGIAAVKALRRQGVTSLICGLSANQQGDEFRSCGADHFVLKPFPCEGSELQMELIKILAKRFDF